LLRSITEVVPLSAPLSSAADLSAPDDLVKEEPIAPNLLDRRFDGWRVNRAWVADISVPQQAA
jgi:hypothetical protein